jgi:hypothetical protein
LPSEQNFFPQSRTSHQDGAYYLSKKLSGLNTYQRPLLTRVRNLDPSIVLRLISSATRSHLQSRIEIMFERLRKSINQKWPIQKPGFTEANIHPVLKKDELLS